MPGPQSTQAVAPCVLAEYLPAPHVMQLAASTLPGITEYFPGGHRLQELEPEMVENFPASHSVQSASEVLPAVWPYLPRSQLRHALSSLAPTKDECLPRAQAKQSDSASLPDVSTYLPRPQSVQAVAPSESEYLPAWQGSHHSTLDCLDMV